MLKISQEDRMFLISHGVDISLPLCQNDLWGVLDIIVDALVDSRQSHNNEVSAELKKLLTELIATIQKRNKRLHNQEKRSATAGRLPLPIQSTKLRTKLPGAADKSDQPRFSRI